MISDQNPNTTTLSPYIYLINIHKFILCSNVASHIKEHTLLPTFIQGSLRKETAIPLRSVHTQKEEMEELIGQCPFAAAAIGICCTKDLGGGGGGYHTFILST
jgi:hypothetical protein